jgi:hypothetical protein
MLMNFKIKRFDDIMFKKWIINRNTVSMDRRKLAESQACFISYVSQPESTKWMNAGCFSLLVFMLRKRQKKKQKKNTHTHTNKKKNQ